jgi:hypothetical protein
LHKALQENPELPSAGYLTCLAHASELLTGTASPEVAALRSQLTGGQRTSFEAYLAMQRGDMATVAALDNGLAGVSPEDLAYVTAVSCRAAWLATPQPGADRLRNGVVSLELIDRALSLAQTDYGYLIRFNAARMAARPQEQLETIRGFIQLLQQSEVEPDLLTLQRLNTMRTALRELQADPRITPGDAQQVAQLLSQLAADLQMAAEDSTMARSR